MTTLGEYAKYIRSKNAGPFWMTLDVFFASSEDYEKALTRNLITPELINRLYLTPVDQVRIFHCESLNTIKISIPRPTSQGGVADRDVHSGQQFSLLFDVTIDV